MTGPQTDQEPREECGVFGVWAPGEDVAKLTYYGLYALQHRGQEAAGIAVADGSQVLVFKDLGLVSQVFDEQTLAAMQGHVAIGHCRYSTTGETTWENAQPVFRNTAAGTGVALGHNGNLVNTAELASRAREAGLIDGARRARGHHGLRHLGGAAGPRCGRHDPGAGGAGAAADGARRVLPDLHGREHPLRGARSHGVRPLCAGPARPRLGGGHPRPPRSTSSAPRSSVTSSRASCWRSTPTACGPAGSPTLSPKGCIFEYVYLARPGQHDRRHGPCTPTRVEIGRRLARENPVEADLVIGVPESGTPAAVGYAQESGIPYGQGLMKNAYVGRTFIQPSQTIRQLGIRLKLNPLKEVIRGKRLIVVDDSIVRGNTQRALVRMLREAGAVEVHVRIASPPVKWPCFYGIDFATPAELIANASSNGGNESEMLEAVRHAIGADTLGYISQQGMVAATEQPASRLCTACFDGEYPIELPGETALGKNVIEQMLATAARTGVPVQADNDNVSALRRP